MEQVLKTGQLEDAQIAGLIAKRRVFPCFFGAALQLQGVDELLSALQRYTVAPSYPAEFSAQIYKIARGEKDERLTFLKVTGGCLRVKQALRAEDWEEKADQLRLYSGNKYTLLQQARAGMVCAVTGLSRTQAGEHLGAGRPAQAPVLEPVLEYRMHADTDDLQGAYLKLRRLEEEDPQLHLVWDHQLREIRVQLMGPVQMEILQRLIAARFGLSVRFDEGNIVYKETIAAPVEGVGHYEPLRHYAEVWLKLEPGAPGSGVSFAADCPPNSLEENWQRLIRTHVFERAHPGVLTGSPLCDVRIRLIAGRAHLKHTEGGDFREATCRAIRNALMQAENVLLEPVVRFELAMPNEALARVTGELLRIGAQLDASETDGGETTLTGRCTAAMFWDYPTRFAASTRGHGRIASRFDRYEPCKNQDDMVRQIGYDPLADTLNPPGSVFCSHGAGFYVAWDHVREWAHCEVE